ncbi:uncharacterized protein LOC112562640 isoform X5 [Pomacea canaliculata]|uniref:uncharacterized protein LOC112562640 isoform X5 n=1 Tax=Pomacea canaliculata TaxID=400727 RepID=UPI000D73A654|nr:uncharacterized protein LOC112562640 isoform X5 [Pomacea canaliculata]
MDIRVLLASGAKCVLEHVIQLAPDPHHVRWRSQQVSWSSQAALGIGHRALVFERLIPPESGNPKGLHRGLPDPFGGPCAGLSSAGPDRRAVAFQCRAQEAFRGWHRHQPAAVEGSAAPSNGRRQVVQRLSQLHLDHQEQQLPQTT